MPLWVINDAKLDRRYGVDINSIYVPGGARLTQSLIAGDIDIALTGGAVVTADLSGADLTYVAIGLSTYGFYVYAKPEIKEVRDLGGKILGVITKGASSDHAAIALVRRYGMREGQERQVPLFLTSRRPLGRHESRDCPGRGAHLPHGYHGSTAGI